MTLCEFRAVFLIALLYIYDDFDCYTIILIFSIFSLFMHVFDHIVHWFSFILVHTNSRFMVRINICFSL